MKKEGVKDFTRAYRDRCGRSHSDLIHLVLLGCIHQADGVPLAQAAINHPEGNYHALHTVNAISAPSFGPAYTMGRDRGM